MRKTESNRKKYIFIVQVTRQLSIDILNNFADQGAEIELVTGVVESNYAPLYQNIKVKYYTKYDNTTGFKRMLTWLLFTFSSFFYVFFSNKKKELIIITTPPFIVFIGLFFKQIRNQNYHLIIWDLYPDVLVNFGVLKKSSWIIYYWEKLNKTCFTKASNVFTLGQHLADAISKYTTKTPIIIPNWVNADFVKPMEKTKNLFAKQYQLIDKFVIMYSGNMGLTHNMESIVYTANLLKENKQVQFVVIGDGAKKAKIQQYVLDKKLDNVLILNYQDKEMLPYSLSCADIGIVTLSQGAETISVPSKTYYTLAAGSVILALASHQSELGLLIENYHCGKVFENPNPTEIAEFIEELLHQPDTLKTYKENARKASYNFTPENAKQYYNYICDKNE